MRDLRDEEQFEETQEEAKRERFTIKLEDTRTPLYFLSSKVSRGWAHWYTAADGSVSRCFCPNEDKPDENTCPVCKIILSNQKRIHGLEKSGQNRKAAALKEINNRIRAKYEMRALAAKGEFSHAGKLKDGSDKFVISYEDAEVGIYSFSQKQKEDFLGLVNQKSKYPWMTGPGDLFNRTIMFIKKKKTNPDTGKEYFIYEIIPGKKPLPRPKITVEKGKFNLDEAFEVDEEALAKMARSILGGGKKHEVEYENDEEALDEEDLEEEESEEKEDETPRRRAHKSRKKVSHDDEDTEDDGGGGSDEDGSESDDDESDDEDSDEFEDADSGDGDDEEEEESDSKTERVKGKKKKFDDSFIDALDESEGPEETEEFEDDNPEEDAAPPRRRRKGSGLSRRSEPEEEKPARRKTRPAAKKRPRR